MNRKIVIIILIIIGTAALAANYVSWPAEEEKIDKTMKKVFLTTADGMKIAGEYFPADGEKGVMLLHMMPATKESWGELPLKLQERGYKVLAIDLRGHGESDGGPSGYLNFSDAEHQKSIQDVNAAAQFLAEKGVAAENLVLVGASIGANLALQYLAENPAARESVLLSAGLDYRGVKTEQYARKLTTGQRVFFASSEDDEDNVAMNQKLFNVVPAAADKKILIYKKAGHGTNMFGKEESDLEAEILSWLK